ncbi:MAG: ATP-dependent zinc protease [Bdellovibrionales bacterium]|nr:ATP-dependent zinc protease [Bdellovibrionales bacterium]
MPDLHLPAVKAKVDSGARTSALHAVDIEVFIRRGHPRVRFKVCPDPAKSHRLHQIEAPMLEKRHVRSSIGFQTQRPVILTLVKIAGQEWPIEITLIDRTDMGFPMLLGRTAIRGRFFIDPSRSFLQTPNKLPKFSNPS